MQSRSLSASKLSPLKYKTSSSVDTAAQFIKKQYPARIPILTVTGLSKLYGHKKPFTKQSTIFKRVAQSSTNLHTGKLIDYISTQQSTRTKSNPQNLSQQQTKKIFQNFCNPQGKLTAEYLLKMAKETGFPMNEQMAQKIVRKYARKKNFLTLQTCQNVIQRHYGKHHLQSRTNSKIERSEPRVSYR